MQPSDFISLLALVVSLGAGSLAYVNYRRDRGNFELSASLMIKDKEKQIYISLTVTNVGIRPITVKDMGTVSWAFGSYGAGKNKNLNKTLKEAESFVIDEPIESFSSIRRIKDIGVRDHSGKLYLLEKKQLYRLYDLSFGNEKRDNKFNDLNAKKHSKNRSKSLKKYLKFIQRYNLENELKGKAGLSYGDNLIDENIRKEFEIK
jgi:hypothetical protein